VRDSDLPGAFTAAARIQLNAVPRLFIRLFHRLCRHLKTWLAKALRMALATEAQSLDLHHLQQNEFSSARRKQIQQEAEAGEQRWLTPTNPGKPAAHPLGDSTLNSASTSLRPGQRRAKRDAVGVKPYAS
jgi:hypothetical protein